MERARERGNTLLETAVAVGIVAVVAGAVLQAAIAAARGAGSDATREALQDAVAREMRVAKDVLKYQGADIAPITVATALPMPSGSPLAAELSIDAASLPHGALRVTISATATGAVHESATSAVTLGQRVPLPGSQAIVPGSVPAPTGAP